MKNAKMSKKQTAKALRQSDSAFEIYKHEKNMLSFSGRKITDRGKMSS